MKNSFKIYCLLMCIFTSSFAGIINVPADIDSIQGGINLATDGDTVLVQPGEYVENLEINKNIVLASLFLTTSDSSYITQTLINGNQSGSAVDLDEVDSTMILCGFTIYNGRGDCYINGHCDGGGVNCNRGSPTLKNLRIEKNTAVNGGGILMTGSNPKLIDVRITENTAGIGGGISSHRGPRGRLNSNPSFDQFERCSIYLNTAVHGSDLYSMDTSIVEVFLDTFTVLHPTNFHAYQKDRYIFDIQNVVIQQANNNLYVNPNGHNSNSGLSATEPLQTIDYALKKIMADSLNPHTIYLANGIYGPQYNSEFMPIGLTNYVSIFGETEEGVILIPDSTSHVVFTLQSFFGISIENLTIKGNDHSGIDLNHSNIMVKNVIMNGARLELRNSNSLLEKIKISGNTDEAGILMYGSTPTIVNVEISNNTGWLTGGLRCEDESHAKLINCTISGNESNFYNFGGVHINSESSIQIINSILWNNQNYQIGVNLGGAFPDVSIAITNSLV